MFFISNLIKDFLSIKHDRETKYTTPSFRLLPVVLLASAGFAASASNAHDAKRQAPVDYYAAREIRTGDFATAERILKIPVDKYDNDPGRLINLARVYLATHRAAKARRTLELVKRLPNQDVILDTGKIRSSDALASQMLTLLRSERG